MSISDMRIGDILKLERRAVVVEPGETYREIGVRSFGRGLFEKEPTSGADLGSKRVFHVHPGDLVVSNIFAWEGAVAVAQERHEGMIGSHRFMTWVPDAWGVDVEYLRHYFASDPGLGRLGSASPGSAGRNRTLSIKNFENIVIPLPDLDEQHRIAAHLDAVATSTGSVAAASSAVDARAYIAALPSLSSRLFSAADLPTTSVDQLCSSVNDTVHPGDDRGLADVFVGLEYVEPHTGRRLGSRPVGDEKGRKFRFQPGDVLFGYLRPYLNKVWVSDRHGLCSVEQFVLRPALGVASKDLAFVLRSAIVLDQAVGLTHSLQLPRLRLPLLMGIRVPDIRLATPDLVDALDSLSLQVVRIADLRQKQSAVVANLLPSARNEIFNAMV